MAAKSVSTAPREGGIEDPEPARPLERGETAPPAPAKGIARWNLRLRVALFFALLALCGAAAALVPPLRALAAGVLAQGPAGDLARDASIAAFAFVGLAVWVALKFDDHVAKPILAVVRDARAAAHAGGSYRVDAERSRYLGFLAPAVAEVAGALKAEREASAAKVEAATAEAELQKARLEAVLRDLEQGVVICNLEHELTLCNRRAAEILGDPEELGLGRPFLPTVAPEPFRHALRRLTNRWRSGRFEGHPEGLTAPVAAATARGGRTLKGRMTLTFATEEGAAGGGEPTGYVVTFEDVTETLKAAIERDRLAHEAIADVRARVTAMALAGETALDAGPETPPEAARTLAEAPVAVNRWLERLDASAGEALAAVWTTAPIAAAALFELVSARDSEGRGLRFAAQGAGQSRPLWLRCDGNAVTDLLDRLANRVAERSGADSFALAASPLGNGANGGAGVAKRVLVELSWQGPRVPSTELNRWLGERLDAGLGPYTGRDVLDRHRTEARSEALPPAEDGGAGRACLRLPLPRALEAEGGGGALKRARVRGRPEFYDFDLAKRAAAGAVDREAPLRKLTYVVFDTETTGLEPSKDAIVSVAGVRVAAGRILRGEAFDRLVDPGRPIPKASTKIHGISDSDVEGAPPAAEVLERFRAFVGDAVLVAHNAAFDMKFLAAKEAEAGVRFDRPVLDTVLLAAAAFGEADDLTLDALAERFAVDLPARVRHTALGDSLATAEVLLALVGVLEAQGVRSLGQALEASARQTAIRKRQAAY